MALRSQPLLGPTRKAANAALKRLLAEAAWRHLLVHDYAHARNFYAFLRHLQPDVAAWHLGEALAQIKCGQHAAARQLLKALAPNACTKAQAQARARLLVLAQENKQAEDRQNADARI